METYVEFRSDQFPPYESEQYEVNPGRYGKRLADFLQQGLFKRGFEAEKPSAEDWGWIVNIRNDHYRLWIGCGNYDEYPEDGFLCFIDPHKPTIRRFLRKIDVSERVRQLRDAVDDILNADPSIRGKRWWTFDDFRNPSARANCKP